MKLFLIIFGCVFGFFIWQYMLYIYNWDANINKAKMYQNEVPRIFDSMVKYIWDRRYYHFSDSFNYYQSKTYYYNTTPETFFFSKPKP